MKIKIVLFVIFYSLCCKGDAQLAGDLDSTFSFDGYTTSYYNPNGSFTDIAIQTDGKIVATGHNGNNEMVTIRYNNDGSVDNTFGVSGIVTKYFGGFWTRYNEIQSDGKIVIGGTEYDGSNAYFSLLRYNTDGTVDSSFDFDGQASFLPGIVNNNLGDLKVQADGKILIAGISANVTPYNDMTILRINADGSVDSTFDSDGYAKKALTGFYPTIYSMAIQPDNKILISGAIETGGLHKYIILRFNGDGSCDSTFDTDGIVQSALTADHFFRSIVLQSDGKIVAIGQIIGSGGKDFLLARFKTNGSLDSLFGVNGIQVTDFTFSDDYGYDVCVQSDNKIVAVGYSISSTSYFYGAVARYDSAGTLDANFGSFGEVTNLLGQFTAEYSCKIQTDGRIVAVGSQIPMINNNQYFLVARYLAESQVGIIQLENEQNSSTYPNPFEKNIIIQIGGHPTNGIVSVIDSYGKMVFSKMYEQEKEINLDLSMVQSGLYFIHIISNNGEANVFKIIKQ